MVKRSGNVAVPSPWLDPAVTAGRIGLKAVDAALDSASGAGGRAPCGRKSMMASPQVLTAVRDEGVQEEVDVDGRGLMVS